MSTYIITLAHEEELKNQTATIEAKMKGENFVPVNGKSSHRQVFMYYGNLGIQHVTEMVKMIVLSVGKTVSFTVIKDKYAEKQFHKNNAARYLPSL
jgi:hypothetical protein